jgi:hypothetical protein
VSNSPGTPPAATAHLLPRGTTDALADFTRRHPGWVARFTGDEPVYAIPLPAVERLARPAGRDTPPFFDVATTEAERAFTQLCEENLIVGIHAGGPKRRDDE